MRHSYVIVAAITAGFGLSGAPSDERLEARVADSRDSAYAVAAVEAMRGANPLLCELAARAVEGRNGWGGMDHSGSGSDLEADAQMRDVERWLNGGMRNARSIIAPLTPRLRDPDRCVRRAAATLLGRTRDDGAVSALLAALGSEDVGARQAAAIGLGFADKERAVQPLSRALADADAGVRSNAAWALGEIESRDAVPALVNAMKDGDARVRRNAAWALGEIEDAAAIPALTTALREERSPEVRRAAAWALGTVK